MATEDLMGLVGVVAVAALKNKLSKGAMPASAPSPAVNFYKANGAAMAFDNRVKITVPDDYILLSTRGSSNGEIYSSNGIIFPYTPSITFEHKATYSPVTPTHSNFTQYFYQNSSVTPITISGKFSVENDTDAEVLLSVIHLLRSLTKMRTGDDTNAGAPPPVCRLHAYGDYMLENIPVVISSFKHELPDSVDYYTTAKMKSSNNTHGTGTVPTISTITIICNPVYSRDEIKNFNVTGWLTGTFNQPSNGRGYL